MKNLVKCINALGYESSVDLNGIYPIVSDERNTTGFIRIMDKYGEISQIPAFRFIFLAKNEEQAA